MWVDTLKSPEQQISSKTEDFVWVREWSSKPTIENNIWIVLETSWTIDEKYINATSSLIYNNLEKNNTNPTWFDIIGWHIIAYYHDDIWSEQYLVFSIHSQGENISVNQVDYSIENLWKLSYAQEKNAIEQISHSLEELEIVLNAMDSIFSNNLTWANTYWSIDEDDIFTPDKSISPWKDIDNLPESLSLVYLQKLAESMIWKLDTNIENLPDKAIKENKRKLSEYSEKYIDFVMGIGAKYEWGAAIFKEEASGIQDDPDTPHDESIQHNVSEDKVFELLDFMVENKSIDELLQYMVDAHYKIDLNDYQSTEVERSYNAWRHTVHTSVLNKMKEENVEDEYFLQYSRIVTGRESKYTQNINPTDTNWGLINDRIDNRYKDPEAAQDALLHVCNRENGIISKIQTQPWSNFVVEDPEMWNLSPFDVLDLATSSIHKNVEWMQDNIQSWNVFLREIGFGDIVNSIAPDTQYHDLDLAQKMKIAILLRVSKKLNRKRKKIDTNTLADVFIDATQDGQKVLIDSFEDNFNDGWFGTKSAKDFNLTGVDSEIFELYMDIEWIGFFNPADNTKSLIFEITKIAALIAPIILIGIWTAIILAPTTLVGIAGTAAAGAALGWISAIGLSTVIHPKWYDTSAELLTDIGSDFALWAWLWAWVAWWMAYKWMEWLKYITPEIGVWMWLEIVRSWQVETRLYGRDRYSLPEFHEFIEIKSKELRALADAESID